MYLHSMAQISAETHVIQMKCVEVLVYHTFKHFSTLHLKASIAFQSKYLFN